MFKILMKLKTLFFLVLLSVVTSSIYGALKPLPEDISLEGCAYKVSDVDFLYDLTYEKNNVIVHEQNIFNEIFNTIEKAEKFIIADMFLFNDEYDRQYKFPNLSTKLVEELIAKKKKYPEIVIVFITDPINTFYGSYKSSHLERLSKNGIKIVITDLSNLRDSNPVYSGLWRLFIQWFDTSGKGWLPNPFSPDSPKVTLRSYLKSLNFKANHRKVLVTEKAAIISSANPHDASAYHSNVAFLVKGSIIEDIVRAEKAVAKLSGENISIPFPSTTNITKGNIKIRFLTEGKIKKHLIESLENTKAEDTIQIGMFYLAEKEVIQELLEAAARGVKIRIILDANKDAFGRKKNGIPNRPVAQILNNESNGKIKIKWYNTNGEQFHAKIVMLKYGNHSVIYGGSANLTRRNLDNFNLEADIKITAPNDSKIVTEIDTFFNRLWNNLDGKYTLNFESFNEKSPAKKYIYLLQEWSGISTF